MSKYGNHRTVIDGIRFDSKREAERWCELRLLERAGEIKELQRQVSFELIPAQKNGKVKSVKYVADFTYETRYGKYVVEDAKGVKTEVYKIKKKLMLERYGIEVVEV